MRAEPMKASVTPSYPIKKIRLVVTKKEILGITDTHSFGPFDISYEGDTLEARTLAKLVEMLRQNRLRADETGLLGEYLYRVILQNEIGDELHKSLFNNEEQECFLRVELEFSDWNTGLIDLPWEYLFRRDPKKAGGYFLARQDRLALVRRPRDDFRALRVKGNEQGNKLKVLLVACSPCDLPRLEFGSLVESLALLPELHVTPLITEHVDDASMALAERGHAAATFANFREKLQEIEPHVIHFLGHGKCDPAGGSIAFVTSGYGADWKKGTDLATELTKCKSVRLAFLQACETAIGDAAVAYRALSSVAGDLVQTMIPAIVAMQAKVENAAANTFADIFYSAVVKEKQPLYRAMQMARMKAGEMACIPVLYLGQDKKGENDPAILMSAADDTGGTLVGGGVPSPGVPKEITCPWCGEVRVLKVASARPKTCSLCTSPLRCKYCGTEFQTEIRKDQKKYFCDCGTWNYRAGEEPPSGSESPPLDGFVSRDPTRRMNVPAGSASGDAFKQ